MSTGSDAETPARRWGLLGLEALCAFGTAIAFTLLCLNIQVDPTARMGQVSGLASMQVRFMMLAGPLVIALLASARLRGGAYFPFVSRLVCAAASGLASGMVAGGLVVALRGTAYGLNAEFGDSAVLARWAGDVLAGNGIPTPYYPPAQVYGIAAISQLQGGEPIYALKLFNTIGLLVIGPCSYLAWRLWLRPGWALVIGGIASLPMIEAYRPYPLLVLVIFVPVIARCLDTIRRADDYDVMQLARRGVIYGVVLAVLFLVYSGWFHWSAPGVIAAGLALFPYRRAPRRAALFVGIASVVFALLAGHYILGVLQAPPIADEFHYFDSRSDPAYVAMWRGDIPGPFAGVGEWPPVGELGGIGAFMIVLAIGAGAACALGRTHTLVVSVGALLMSAWFLRFWKAHFMWKTKLVQLYPRTTAQILLCLLLASGLAIMWATQRARRTAPADSPLRTRWGLVGAVLTTLFLFAQAGSHVTDRYMPNPTDGHLGQLAWTSHRGKPSIARTATVRTSSERSSSASAAHSVIDSNPQTAYTSELHASPRVEEWIEIELPHVDAWSRTVITPAEDGWPTDFIIELWDGTSWVERYRGVDVPRPAERLELPRRSEATSLVRLRATKLGAVRDGFALRIAEIELIP